MNTNTTIPCKPSQPKQPSKPDYSKIYTSTTFRKPKLLGNCNDGTYVEIYIPDKPNYGDNGTLKAVIYLHGFALGASEIYRSHIEHLVKQGYYVIYPNYQHGFCKFPPCRFETILELAEEALRPFPISPQKWINSAIYSAMNAYEQENLDKLKVDTYLFGHSLGGLFALSWNYYARDKVPVNMLPKQIVVADPVPDSESNIPKRISQIIKKLGGFKDKIDIQTTGDLLKVPVAILHGNEDTIIDKGDWKKLFQYIASNQKAMYLSFTDDHGCPAIYANHEQATVDTSFLPKYLTERYLNGSGKEDNLNWRFIWDALDQVIRGTRADQLQFDMGSWSDDIPIKPILRFL